MRVTVHVRLLLSRSYHLRLSYCASSLLKLKILVALTLSPLLALILTRSLLMALTISRSTYLSSVAARWSHPLPLSHRLSFVAYYTRCPLTLASALLSLSTFSTSLDVLIQSLLLYCHSHPLFTLSSYLRSLTRSLVVNPWLHYHDLAALAPIPVCSLHLSLSVNILTISLALTLSLPFSYYKCLPHPLLSQCISIRSLNSQ